MKKIKFLISAILIIVALCGCAKKPATNQSASGTKENNNETLEVGALSV